MVSVITNDGKNNLLNVGFGLGGNPFLYMAVGVGTEAPSEESTALNSEVSDLSYTRVELVNTPDTDLIMMSSEGTFLTTNITTSTTIKEIGIVDTDVIGTGIFWCICQVEDTEKDDEKQVKFTVFSTMVECP